MSNDPDQGTQFSTGGQGWTPLSVRLAAYGESLALERRLKKEEEERAALAEAKEAVGDL
jgi:hypothetical protein